LGKTGWLVRSDTPDDAGFRGVHFSFEWIQQHLDAAGSSVVVPSTDEMIETVVDALFRAFSASEQPASK
jgi:hypothetical protein